VRRGKEREKKRKLPQPFFSCLTRLAKMSKLDNVVFAVPSILH
jgi:hypothetical protein